MSQNFHSSPNSDSDSRYIFILFALIFIVLFFAFLIYFVYGQKQLYTDIPADNPTFEKTLADIQKQTSNTSASQIPLSPTPAPTTTAAVSTNVPPVSTSVARVDLSRYNPRDPSTLNLRGRELLEKYFSSIAGSDYQMACSLLSNTICNSRRDIYSFSQFLNKTTGYSVKNITLAKEQKPSESIFCVEYSYAIKADLNPQSVTEYFQYRIQTRADGVDEISARVCEKIIKDGRERPCPIITPKKYCF